MGGWLEMGWEGEDWLRVCCCKSLCDGMGGMSKAGERRLVIPNRVVGVCIFVPALLWYLCFARKKKRLQEPNAMRNPLNSDLFFRKTSVG